MLKDDLKENLKILGLILVIAIGFLLFIIISYNSGKQCVTDGGKAVYNVYGLFEKCIK